jgi:uncharacterized protein involved in cysteine biosynthesis
MVAILEGLVLGFVLLSMVYALVSVYSRSVRREELEKEFDAGGVDGDREAFIAAGMQDYAHSLRRRLVILVYVVPALAVAAIIYLVNGQ